MAPEESVKVTTFNTGQVLVPCAGRWQIMKEVIYYQRRGKASPDPKAGKKPHVTVCILKLFNPENNTIMFSVGVADWNKDKDAGLLSKKFGKHVARERAAKNAELDIVLPEEVLRNHVMIRQYRDVIMHERPEFDKFCLTLKKVRSENLARVFNEQFRLVAPCNDKRDTN